MPLDLHKHYSDLYQQSVEKIKNGTYSIDELIDDPTDNRFGITVLIRPSEEVKTNIQKFLSELKAIEPLQYYYPNSGIHITLLSIISCYTGFQIHSIPLEKYIHLIEQGLANIQPITIQFKGITASDSCIIIQGFPENEHLNQSRNQLRDIFSTSPLQQSIDKRYSIQTAHATVVRFRNKLQNNLQLVELLERYRNYDFGTFTVQNIELVYNDWYQKADLVKTLHNFSLKH